MKNNCAIFYTLDSYTTKRSKIMGRHVAGESFLRGFLSHKNADRLAVQVDTIDHAKSFKETARALGRKEPITVIDKTTLGTLQDFGNVYYPGPAIGKYARYRSFWGHQSWSLCGITHTISSARAMDEVTQLLTAPIQPWDALICTSSAAKRSVELLLQNEAAYLSERLGASRTVYPKLPIIPLGIHTQDFVVRDSERSRARENLSLSDDTIVVMFMGRLSFHGKAHPLPMYLALEEAARRTGKTVALIECGWHANDYIKRSFSEGAKKLCPNIRVISIDGRKAAEHAKAWASADVFCSLSDNIQETFGITPVEAMAAGLPVVVSDWDGYKDTVRHGIDGFRIPTVMPGAGLGGGLAMRHALDLDTYDMYIGHVCSVTAVDVAATTEAFVALITNEDLRRKMGEAAQARARDIYDWSQIIPQYEELWAEMNEERQHATVSDKTNVTWPARPDPFTAFASYPTRLLTPKTHLVASSPDLEALCTRVEAAKNLVMVRFAKLVFPTPEEVTLVLKRAVKGSARAEELVQDIPLLRQRHVLRALGWLLKLGVLEVDDENQSSN